MIRDLGLIKIKMNLLSHTDLKQNKELINHVDN